MPHELADHSDHPDDSHQMIYMLMRDKNVAHIHPVITGILYLAKNSIAASAVHHEYLPVIFNQKTSVIALRHKRITGS
jgi:hypothetical protein